MRDVAGPGVPALVALFLGLALAGCLGGDDASGSAAAPNPSGPANLTQAKEEGKTLIAGFVLDEAQLPIPNAEVGLLHTEIRTQYTDEGGLFVFADLAPATYTVVASKLGFDAVQRVVELGAGEQVEDLEIVLPPMAVPLEPYWETFIEEGYIACGAKIATVTISNINVCLFDDQHKPQVDFAVKGGNNLVAVQLELEWQETSGVTGAGLRLELWKNPNCIPSPCAPDVEYPGDATGPSPLKLVVGSNSAPIREGIAPEGETLLSSMTFTDGDDPVVLQFQQRVTHYISVWYNQAPPEDFTLIG